MGHLGDRASHGGIVGPLHNLIELGESQAAYHLFMSFWRGYETPVVLNSNSTLDGLITPFCSFVRHKTSPFELGVSTQTAA